jgi:hypothetical protein
MGKMEKLTKNILLKTVLLVAVLFMWVPFTEPAAAQTLPEVKEQARAAGIDQSLIAELEERAGARGISEDALAGIVGQAVAMAGQNLPYEMIFDKAFEGISKGVPAGRLQPVLTSIAESSAQSAEIVDRWIDRPGVEQMLARSGERMDRQTFRNEMIKAGSKGLMQNFDRQVLEQTLESVVSESVLERSRPSGIISAVNILSDLPEAAEQPADAARIVLRALEGGFDASELQKLPGAMNMAQRRSQLPAQAVAQGLSRQLQGGLPASQILQNLFNGEIGGGPPGNVPPGLDGERPGRGQRGPPE